MLIATWNVNSVRSRLPHLLGWLKSDKPDIVLLQETKCTDEAFPSMEIEELGYNIAMHGEKSYNGVAILSKFPLSDIARGLPGCDEDAQTRYIEAVASVPGGVVRVASVYVPNGQTPDSDKFQYKLKFLDRLHAHLQTLLSYEEMLAIGGDYNIAPYDIDVHNPARWANTVLCHPQVRAKLRAMLHGGMQDAWRLTHSPSPLAGEGRGGGVVRIAAPPPPNPLPQGEGEITGFTWWDYRAGAFDNDDGLRIDHLLLSPQAADHLMECKVEKNIRALEKASDHAPVIVILASA